MVAFLLPPIKILSDIIKGQHLCNIAYFSTAVRSLLIPTNEKKIGKENFTIFTTEVLIKTDFRDIEDMKRFYQSMEEFNTKNP